MEELQTTIATRVARKIFERRGNHSEAHLGEDELVTIIAASLGLYQEQVDAKKVLA